jgi:hypothetical protein
MMHVDASVCSRLTSRGAASDAHPIVKLRSQIGGALDGGSSAKPERGRSLELRLTKNTNDRCTIFWGERGQHLSVRHLLASAFKAGGFAPGADARWKPKSGHPGRMGVGPLCGRKPTLMRFFG